MPISTSEAMLRSKIVAFRAQKNPNVIIEKPMHPQRVTVWCGFGYGGIIAPFFLENEQGAAVTVNGERYRAMLNEFMLPKKRTVFENRIISRNSDVNWPPRSCYLTPLDYFLWGAVKDKCYANYPETIEALKYEIEIAIHGIEAQTIENVLKNWVDRMEYCKPSRGSHLIDVFHS